MKRVLTFCAFVLLLPLSLYCQTTPHLFRQLSHTARTTPSSISGVSSPDTLFQVFPLAPRLQYVYKYWDSYQSLSGIIKEDYSVDTGFVTYTILDSSIANDSTVLWEVSEIKTLWDSTWYGWGDSTHLTRDTAAISIHESTVGFHMLRVDGMVWHFPLDSDLQVYRYADSANVVLNRTGGYSDWNGGEVSVHDSVDLSADSGLFYRSSGESEWYGAGTGWTYGMSMKLQGSPVLAIKRKETRPSGFALMQNYPNPFNPTTAISYELSANSFVSLKVYDVLGREVGTLVNKVEQPGSYTVTFDASGLASGVYFYKLKAGSYSQTRKLVILK